jgi:anhydro-N-acetylmuramic acid kinase
MKIHKILGLMSGTSLDGLDLAYCHFIEKKGGWSFDIQHAKSISYATSQQNELKDAILLGVEELFQLHNNYGTWLGEQARDFIEEQQLKVDHIASHGHTTHHRPELGFTVQIGSGQHLANASRHKVISDFRTNDIALGGQGAPLVPIGDYLLFNEYDFCLNLGGISNVSFETKGKRIAYDIGLANMILNYITRKIDLEYDKNGALARLGSRHPKMLQKLNALEYYLLPHPKSIGYEWFLEKVVPIVDGTDAKTEDLLHTAVHHICEKIAQQIHQNTIKVGQKVLITGGGALNTFLIETLTKKLGSEIKVVVPDKQLIDFKEAMVFAFMGALRAEKLPNILSSVTGASRNSSSGTLYLPS